MMFRYLTEILDSKTMMANLYYSFIYPYLIYGIEFWGDAPDYLTSKILMSIECSFLDSVADRGKDLDQIRNHNYQITGE